MAAELVSPSCSPPILLSTWSFSVAGAKLAWPTLAAVGAGAGGERDCALEACLQVCGEAERDPRVDSVGYGGLPDASGRVSLDGAVMESPSRCGSVCGLRRHLHPVRVAASVMRSTRHVMLAGDDADRFASQHGHLEAELLSPEARAKWEAWRSDPHAVDQSRDQAAAAGRPTDGGNGAIFGASGMSDLLAEVVTTGELRWREHDTVGVLTRDSGGRLAGACSTSGTPFKVPGRVGDSPIIGSGLFVDPGAGAATGTGTGELIMGVCGAHLAVEEMRRGAGPTEAIIEVLRRVDRSYSILPHHQVAMIAIHADGRWGSAALRKGFLAVIHDEAGCRTVEPEYVHRAD
ncbi:MAG: isoaspartyl peptidase/L-asparaginase [Planctomycetota bacterium]|nr:isoaspartyl peptidase/L-asparaginase [Planctomycetota bacterium]